MLSAHSVHNFSLSVFPKELESCDALLTAYIENHVRGITGKGEEK